MVVPRRARPPRGPGGKRRRPAPGREAAFRLVRGKFLLFGRAAAGVLPSPSDGGWPAPHPALCRRGPRPRRLDRLLLGAWVGAAALRRPPTQQGQQRSLFRGGSGSGSWILRCLLPRGPVASPPAKMQAARRAWLTTIPSKAAGVLVGSASAPVAVAAQRQKGAARPRELLPALRRAWAQLPSSLSHPRRSPSRAPLRALSSQQPGRAASQSTPAKTPRPRATPRITATHFPASPRAPSGSRPFAPATRRSCARSE